MKLQELIYHLEKQYPIDLQEDWDNSGLQIGDQQQEIRKVLLTLDINEEVVEKALAYEADLVLSHHPLLFSGIKQIEKNSRLGKILYLGIQNNLAFYSAHTNLDQAAQGVGQVLGDLIGLENQEVFIRNPEQPDFGYGRVGTVTRRSAGSFLEEIKPAFLSPFIITYGNMEREIEKVAILGGSGGSFIDQALEAGVDLYLTGDLKYHEAMEAKEKGLLLADLGHYESEYPVLQAWASWLEAEFPQLESLVYQQKIERQGI